MDESNQNNQQMFRASYCWIVGFLFLLYAQFIIFAAVLGRGSLTLYLLGLLFFVIFVLCLRPKATKNNIVSRFWGTLPSWIIVLLSPLKKTRHKKSSEQWKCHVARVETIIIWIANIGSIVIIDLSLQYVDALWSDSPWRILLIYLLSSIVMSGWYFVVLMLFMGHEQIVYEKDMEYGLGPDDHKRHRLTIADLMFWPFLVIFLGPIALLLKFYTYLSMPKMKQ